jgi:rubrerythrin
MVRRPHRVDGSQQPTTERKMKHEIHQRPSFALCARDGYFFCRDCGHVVQRIERDYLPAVCAECGSVRVHWQPPVFANGQDFLLRHPGKQSAD